MKDINQASLVRVAYVLVVLDFTFHIFNTIPIFDRHYLFWGVAFLLAIICAKPYFRSSSFVWLMVYISVVIYNVLIGDYFFVDYKKAITEFIALFVPATIACYMFRSNDKILSKHLTLAFGLFLIESTIVSYYADSLFPGIMRLQSSAHVAEQNASILDPFVKLGLSDYILPHAIPVIVPGLVYCIKKSKGWFRGALLLILLASIMLSYVSGSFTALLLSLTSLALSLLINNNSKQKTRTRLIVALFVIVPIAISKPLQLTIFEQLQSVLPVDNLAYNKIEDIKESIVYGEAEGSVDLRKEKYDRTIDAITQGFLIGTDNDIIGGHSSLFDRLAALGIVGFIPYILLIFYQIKETLKWLSEGQKNYYHVGLFVALIMMTVKASSYWAMWYCLFAFLPMLLWMQNDVSYIKFKHAVK